MQRRRRSEDDEIENKIRKEHARVDVDLCDSQLTISCAFPLTQRASTHSQFFFDFQARLPEEKVRRDRSTQDRQQHREVFVIKTNGRYESGFQNLAPMGSREKGRQYVSKQTQRQPLKYSDD